MNNEKKPELVFFIFYRVVVPEEEFDGSVVDFLPAERRKVSVMKIGSLNKKVFST